MKVADQFLRHGATLKYLNALGFLALGIFVRATSQELGQVLCGTACCNGGGALRLGHTCKNTQGKLPLGKNSLGKYQTSFYLKNTDMPCMPYNLELQLTISCPVLRLTV